jgi:hypothetical protein
MYSSTLYLTSVLDGVGGQRYVSPTLPPGKTRYPFIGGWAWTGALNLSLPTEIRSPHCPAHSESLYRLSYPFGTSWPVLGITLPFTGLNPDLQRREHEIRFASSTSM